MEHEPIISLDHLEGSSWQTISVAGTVPTRRCKSDNCPSNGDFANVLQERSVVAALRRHPLHLRIVATVGDLTVNQDNGSH